MAYYLFESLLGFVLIAGILFGTGYAVFVLGHSGWWLLGAALLSGFVRTAKPCTCHQDSVEEQHDDE